MSLHNAGKSGVFLTLLAPLGIALSSASWVRAEDAKPPGAGNLHIEITTSTFHGIPAPLIPAMLESLRALVQAQTGLPARVGRSEEAVELGLRLAGGEVQVGVFQGVEFAWAQQQYPELRPLMIAVNQKKTLRSLLIVAADSSAGQFVDLQGKSLLLPRHSRIHCRLFLEAGCRNAASKAPEQFFGRLARVANAEDALDDLMEGQADAVLVDGISWDCYQERKPGRAGQLQVIQQSETFPPSVIGYHPGRLDPAKVNQFREGLLKTSQNPMGRQLMTLWKLSGFEQAPADLDGMLLNIAKHYPPPPITSTVKK